MEELRVKDICSSSYPWI